MMYCQMSSSVQFDSGKTRIDSPWRDAGVVDLPHFRPLVLGVPGMLRRCGRRRCAPWRGDFSSSRRAPPKAASKPYLSSAWRSATVFMMWVWVLEPWVNGTDALAHAVLVDVDQKIDAEIGRHLVAEGDHLPELPGRVDMQERERRLGRIEGLHRQMQHARRNPCRSNRA